MAYRRKTTTVGATRQTRTVRVDGKGSSSRYTTSQKTSSSQRTAYSKDTATGKVTVRTTTNVGNGFIQRRTKVLNPEYKNQGPAYKPISKNYASKFKVETGKYKQTPGKIIRPKFVSEVRPREKITLNSGMLMVGLLLLPLLYVVFSSLLGI